MKARQQALNTFGGGGFVTMNTRPKISRLPIPTALWTRSLTNANIFLEYLFAYFLGGG